MSCPHYKGRYKGGRWLRCENGERNAIGLVTTSKCSNYIKEYCLGKYPECPDFKKSEEVPNE